MTYLEGVPWWEVEFLWPSVEEYIDKVSSRDPDHGTLDIREACQERKMQLWAIVSQSDIIGAIITQINVYPKQKVLYIICMATKDNTIEEWLDVSFETLKDYGRHLGCHTFRFSGRKGWIKHLNPDRVAIAADIIL